MNAIDVLKRDHSAVKNLFSKFDRTSKLAHAKKTEIFLEVRRELQIHARIEQEIFYPALKSLNGEGRKLVSEAVKEHRDIDELLLQIARLEPTTGNFDEKFETLIENVEHHVDEEEGEIFQFAEKNCSAELLDDIGRQIEERKRLLDQQMAA